MTTASASASAASTATATATTSSSDEILRKTTAFVSEILSKTELRCTLFSTLRAKLTTTSNQTTLKPLNLAAEAIDNAISTTSPSLRSSSLRLAEKLLLSNPPNPFSFFLLSLIYSLCRRPVKSAQCILGLFENDPSLARSEIASSLFEGLFLVHLLPVFQCFNGLRSQILSSPSQSTEYFENEYSIYDEYEVIPCTNSLSKMSGDQTSELKDLEGNYEEVLDENCRVFAKYLKEVLDNEDGNRLIESPPLFFKKTGEAYAFEYREEQRNETGEAVFNFMINGRYNPVWAEGERSVELFRSIGSNKFTYKPFCPQRVSLSSVTDLNSSCKLTTARNSNSDSEVESSLDNNSADPSYSSESEAEAEENTGKMALFETRRTQTHKQKEPISAESSRSQDLQMPEYDNLLGDGKHVATPKDFVCPITSNIFDDPVTLETGQTYERKAIQEWLDRGNSTCPITRQKLHNTQLPKTNYVLKRLIASWREQNPGAITNHSENLPHEANPEPNTESDNPSTSPVSVINQATMDGTISELRDAITNLCMSEVLQESEASVLQIERYWQEGNMELDTQTMLSKPPVINGFVEIAYNSVDPWVLKAAIFLLSELGSRDKGVIQTLVQVDSDVECIIGLFKNGLMEAVVLIYLLRDSVTNVVDMGLVDSLLTVIKKKEEDFLKMCIKPKTAALLLLAEIMESDEESFISSISDALISETVMERIVKSLEAELTEERIAAVGILLKCMQKDGLCRNIIADKAHLAPLLESFIGASNGEKFKIVMFLFELVKLSRRTCNEQILHIIKEEGPLSSMHILLVYLQTAPPDQCPVVAGLLLQLDLLAEPRKMSIYREEAIDSLISCIRNTDFPAAQISAAQTIMSLQGRFTMSGKSLTRNFLLKCAGLDKPYNNLMRLDQLGNFTEEVKQTLQEEEDKAADDWERKVASALVSHEFGLLFEALSEGLESGRKELCLACFVSATWLIHMLNVLPDTGIRGAARVCLLKRFVSTFKTAKNNEDKVLSVLALRSFIHEPEGLGELTVSMKDILKGLRELKRFTPLAFEMLKVLCEGQESSADLWNHKDLPQVNCSENGDVLSIVFFKDKIFSGHSDGTIKVWTGKGSILHLIQETREHTKAVTSLAILPAGEKLYSGSLDRTTRVWSIVNETMQCIEVHDMKDQVQKFVVYNSISCFIPHGYGVKVHSWNGGFKLLNPNKYVKCLALVRGKLYCGCHDNSIQEIDLATETISTVQSGSRKLLGKATPVHALQIRDGLLYVAASSLDGTVVKIMSVSDHSVIGSLQTPSEVRAMIISSELIYLGCKGGMVEIWSKENHKRIDVLQSGTNCRVHCMALDSCEEFLVIGTSGGRIQAWGLN